jgi:hypothetical protein
MWNGAAGLQQRMNYHCAQAHHLLLRAQTHPLQLNACCSAASNAHKHAQLDRCFMLYIDRAYRG